MPIFCQRLAAISKDSFDKLHSGALSASLTDLAARESSLQNRIDELTAKLYDLIGRESDHGKRKAILKLKRKLTTPLRIPRIVANNYLSQLPEDYQRSLIGLISEACNFSTSLQAYEELYNSEKVRTREQLKQELSNPLFLRGLMLSSTSVFSNLPKYLTSTSHRLNKFERRMEAVLCNYFSRAAVKTSPFGAFTSVTLARFVNGHKPKGCTDLKTGGMLFVDRLYLCSMLRALESNVNVKDQLAIDWNPTATRRDGVYSFYYHNPSSIAARQSEDETIFTWTVPSTPALELIRSRVLSKRETYGSLLECLIKDSAGDPQDIEDYVGNLITIGLLELNFPITELTHDYLKKIIHFLRRIKDAEISSLLRHLTLLQKQIDSFQQRCYSYDALHVWYQFSQKQIDNVISILHMDVTPASFIYEDSYVPVGNNDLPYSLMKGVEDDLILLSKFGTVCAMSPQVKRLNMRHVFKSHCKGNDEIELIDFFNTYCRVMNEAMKSSNATRRVEKEERDFSFPWNPLDLREIRQLKEYHARLCDVFKEFHSANQETAFLYKDEISELLDHAPDFIEFAKYFAIYGQREKDPESPWVINEMRSGYFKYLSRFIYLTDSYENNFMNDETHKLLYEFEDDEHIIAELGAVFRSNNNVHRPLTKYRIAYPNCYWGEDKDRFRISLSDLIVKLDPSEFPVLYSKTLARRVLPVHIGLNNETHFPQFFQFLLNFEPIRPFLPKPHLIFGPSSQVNGTVPRLMFGNVVYCRQRWFVVKKDIPRQHARQSDAAYFMDLNRWRTARGLPRTLFLIKVPYWIFKEGSAPPERLHQRLARKMLKPKFIDFESPLMASHFYRDIAEVHEQGLIIFEECYPSLDRLFIERNSKPMVSEFFIECKIES